MLVIGDAAAGGGEGVPGSRSSRTRPDSAPRIFSGKRKVQIGSRDDPTAFMVLYVVHSSLNMELWSTLQTMSQMHLWVLSPQSLIRVPGAQYKAQCWTWS